ncbi:hypothetical protein GCM10023226_42400 [Nocardioides nanhaiensis]|uniref:PASTA domain-containing protein n=1 Tax=Nocardioides nanhaiensis TaxID=1476871 RepID=A0ABP8X1G8_9ACTN
MAVVLALLIAGCSIDDASVASRGESAEASQPPDTEPSPGSSTPASPVGEPATPTPPPPVTVPAVAGLPRSEAAQALRAAGLRLRATRKVPSFEPRGTVLRQSVASGTSVTAGSAVALVTAVPHPRVPRVLQTSARTATTALQRAGYRVDLVTRTVPSGKDGMVLRQVPAPLTRTKAGTSITVVVAQVVRPVAPPPAENCTPGYRPCLSPASDYDCAGGSGDGPEYAQGPIYVSGSDPYELDSEGDGVACES